jgi:hypothetical protein
MISDSTISKAREQAARTLWDVPAAAKADPSTSHRAAAEVTASGVRGQNVRKVAHLVRLHPRCTSRELAATSDARELFIDRYEAARRLPDAEALGLVMRAPARRCAESGKQAITWDVPS